MALASKDYLEKMVRVSNFHHSEWKRSKTVCGSRLSRRSIIIHYYVALPKDGDHCRSPAPEAEALEASYMPCPNSRFALINLNVLQRCADRRLYSSDDGTRYYKIRVFTGHIRDGGSSHVAVLENRAFGVLEILSLNMRYTPGRLTLQTRERPRACTSSNSDQRPIGCFGGVFFK